VVRRRFASWEVIMHQAVADYQSAAMLIMSLDMSAPEKFPQNPAEIYDRAGKLYNSAQDLTKTWTADIPKSDILTTSQFHAYRRLTYAIAYTIRMYYDLVPWIAGADTQLSAEAVDFVAEVKTILISQFAIFRDIPAIKRKDIPLTSELVSRMDNQVERKLRPIREVFSAWPEPKRIVPNGWMDGCLLTSNEGEFELGSSPDDVQLTFRPTSSLSSDNENNVIRTRFVNSSTRAHLLEWSAIDWVRLEPKASLPSPMVEFHDDVFVNHDETFVIGGFLHGYESPSGNHFCLIGDSTTPTHEWLRIFQGHNVKVLDAD